MQEEFTEHAAAQSAAQVEALDSKASQVSVVYAWMPVGGETCSGSFWRYSRVFVAEHQYQPAHKLHHVRGAVRAAVVLSKHRTWFACSNVLTCQAHTSAATSKYNIYDFGARTIAAPQSDAS